MALSDTLNRLARRLRGEDGPLDTPVAKAPSEQDVGQDPAVASSRATGGDNEDHEDHTGDSGSITGTGDTDVFVGRTAGLDEGYTEETGAEARRETER